jgi:hypothetical protein
MYHCDIPPALWQKGMAYVGVMGGGNGDMNVKTAELVDRVNAVMAQTGVVAGPLYDVVQELLIAFMQDEAHLDWHK